MPMDIEAVFIRRGCEAILDKLSSLSDKEKEKLGNDLIKLCDKYGITYYSKT